MNAQIVVMNFMSKNMKNKPELKQPQFLDQFSHEDEFIKTEDIKLKWYDELLVVYLPVTLIALFVIAFLRVILN